MRREAGISLTRHDLLTENFPPRLHGLGHGMQMRNLVWNEGWFGSDLGFMVLRGRVRKMEKGFGGMDSGFQGAVKTLDSHFAKADALLQIVHNKLENEFEGTFPGTANPLKLLARTKRLQDELPLLREECDKLLAAKQDLIDSARTTLVKNRTLLCQLQARAGLPVISDADDPIYSSFVKTLEEWDQQMEMVSVTESDQFARPDLNLELFRSKVFKRDE